MIGWEDSHLHQFDFDGAVHGTPSDELPDDPTLPEKGVRLSKALGSSREFTYQYDFGDNWRHCLVVEAVDAPAEMFVGKPDILLDAIHPPEDVGGTSGYAEFLEALADRRHDQHQDYRTWVGGVFDPAGFDVKAVNARLRAIR